MVQPRVELSKTDLAETTREIPIQILYVDDDASFLKTGKAIIEMYGAFQVDTALSVEEAWEKMEKEEYDVVVSDYQMPGKDGLQFLKELREKGNSIPFVLFTGKGREEVAIKALNLGADGYFNKHGEPETVYGELTHGIIHAVKIGKAEEHLRESEEKFRNLAEQSPNMIFINKKGRVVYANDKAADFMGYKKEEYYSTAFNFLCLIAPESRELIKSVYERQMKGEDVYPLEYRLVTRDGRILDAILASKLMMYEGDIAILGTVTDITERKKAEEKVERSSEEWRRTFDAISDFVFTLDKDQRFVRVNKAVCDFLKKEPKELIGKHCYEVLHGTDEPLPNCPSREMLRTKRAVTIEVDDPHSGLSFLMSVSPFLDDKGEHIGCVHVAKDITQRRRSERELFDERMKLQNIFSASPDAIVVIDLSGNIIECNERALKMLQYSSKEEVIGKSAITFLATKEHQRATHSLENTLKDGLTKDVEYTAASKDGHELPIELSASVVRDVSGNPAGFVAIIRDITDHKKAEEALRESEEKFRTIVESIQDVVMLTLPNGIISYLSPACSQVLGYQPEELVGKQPWIFHPDDLEKVKAAHFDALKGKKGSDFGYRIITKKGQTRWISHSWSPIITNGQVKLITSVVVDITKRKKISGCVERQSRR